MDFGVLGKVFDLGMLGGKVCPFDWEMNKACALAQAFLMSSSILESWWG
jgi:hypothetical protein